MSLLSRIAVEAARGFGLFAKKGGVSATYLVVAGGGGGGSNITTYNGGTGGGGAGGYQTSTFSLSTLNTYSIVVGAGGSGATAGTPAAGSNGANSVISGTGLTTVTSIGGGGGGKSGASGDEGVAGGSGGGGGASGTATVSGGAGTSGQGNNGGSSTSTLATYGAGGGGGAGAVGSNGLGNNGGNGGAGVASSISGSSVTYAGGGGGGTYGATAGTGGAGGGGNGSNSTGSSGTTNLGGGGGGGGSNIGGQSGGGSGGSGIVIISYPSSTPLFVGGTITTSGGNQIHTFTSSGTLSPITPITASYLVVAGGGGGGQGGGGAGGLLTSSTTIYSGATYVVTVGGGGAALTNGSDSSFSGTGLTTLTAIGGGKGGTGGSVNGSSGGSGGGGQYGGTGGAGTSGQGFAGGAGGGASVNYPSGGGGGAGAVGQTPASSSANGGNGGIGVQSSISGTATYYAGGGGGGSDGTAGTGGNGGGANGTVNTTPAGATPNTGGGGGGRNNATPAGAGGSGIVIISYAGSQVFNGGLVTSSGGNTIHTFTSTGALTPLTNNLNNSLRFRSSASAYLSRTPTVASNRKTWTLSMWFKLGTLPTADNNLYRSSSDAGANQIWVYFNSSNNNALIFGIRISSTNYQVQIAPIYRDPAAWYHLVYAVDTTQATSSNRAKIYINGQQVTDFVSPSYPPQNSDTSTNNTGSHAFGSTVSGGGYFDGYMTDINFIDGQALEPYYFGNNDVNGVWKPIQYKGTYGTNGFYLTFGNTTSTTTLGYDSSPNGNNWTCNNISLTAGTTYDAMTDVPTNTSATVANYPVYDQLIPANVSGSGVRSISAANLYVTNSGPNGWSAIGTTMVMTSGSGKWYWEVTCSGTTSNGTMIGIHRPFTSTSTFPSAIIGYDTPPDPDGYGYYMGGNKYNNSGAGVAYGASYTAGDVIGVALDMSTAGSASITFYKNNTSQGVAFSSLTGDFFAAVSQAQANGLDINFGQRPFSYTPPTGFVALNTYNLPTPTILQGNKYMDATLYTGNGSTQTIVNQGQFKPDFVWVKRRDGAGQDHVLQDSNRGFSGTTKLASSSTAAENTTGGATGSEWGFVTAANSNGFNITASTNGDQVNKNTWTYVGWQWQAGQGTTLSNTSGSITSTVSVNTTAGFSVVTYTGTGSNATVGHGLGVAPRMIIVKQRSGAGQNWAVYHASLANTGGLALNLTNATITASGWWNNTSPTSSVFSLGGSTGSDWFTTNQSGSTYVAYCWAEIAGFSKFGSYIGNGSTDGPFTYLGFRPEWIMIKGSSASGNPWYIVDSSRNTYNIAGQLLEANSSAAESTYNFIDFLSNGFKIRNTGSGINGSGATFIYAAFAENPFKNANAR